MMAGRDGDDFDVDGGGFSFGPKTYKFDYWESFYDGSDGRVESSNQLSSSTKTSNFSSN